MIKPSKPRDRCSKSDRCKRGRNCPWDYYPSTGFLCFERAVKHRKCIKKKTGVNNLDSFRRAKKPAKTHRQGV